MSLLQKPPLPPSKLPSSLLNHSHEHLSRWLFLPALKDGKQDPPPRKPSTSLPEPLGPWPPLPRSPHSNPSSSPIPTSADLTAIGSPRPHLPRAAFLPPGDPQDATPIRATPGAAAALGRWSLAGPLGNPASLAPGCPLLGCRTKLKWSPFCQGQNGDAQRRCIKDVWPKLRGIYRGIFSEISTGPRGNPKHQAGPLSLHFLPPLKSLESAPSIQVRNKKDH